jgi:hypothetical protein
LARHRTELFGSAWLELTDIKRASVRMVLVTVLVKALSMALKISGVHNEPGSSLSAWSS